MSAREPPARDSIVRVVALASLAAGVLTLLLVFASGRWGRLVAPPRNDDVSYMLDAMRRLNQFHESGLSGVLSGLVSEPPHSPSASALAAIGFTVFGRCDWAPYASNGVLLAGMLGAAWLALCGLHAWQRFAVMAALLPLPIVAAAVQEFRPDEICGFLLACGVVSLLSQPLHRQEPRRFAMVGALFGGALLCKPTAFPSILAVGATAMAGALIAAAILAGRSFPSLFGAVARRCLIVCGVCLGLAGPFFVIAGENVSKYIWANVWGPRSTLWRANISLPEHLRYYLDGPGAQFMLGPSRYACLLGALLLFALAMRLGPRDSRALRVARVVATAIAFAAATATTMKQPFFGLQFFLLVIGGVLVDARDVLAGLISHRRASWAASAMLLLIALVSISTFRLRNTWGSRDDRRYVEMRQVYRQVCDAVTSRAGNASLTIVTFAGALNAGNLEYDAARRGRVTRFKSREWAQTLDDYKPLLATASFVLAAEPGNGLTADQFPSGRALRAVLTEIDASAEWRRVARIPVPSTGRSFLLYERINDGWLGKRKGPSKVYLGRASCRR